ncbi:DUF7352 domain-containing protein [Oceanospirillum sediminis]|uniref:DUF7352 domain-containing protein n=1 Tax=Oceanospirillum sediminis TaxID=2760088 RepID=A0A839IU57_9GAMM|nr:hypothetical protein [Oceanospirillum sediminis]MBB1488983.1 hypothetical protein [Oceanospirillum sediminis]
MKTILKYKVNTDQPQLNLTLRPGFRVVRFDYLLTEKSLYLWIEQTLRPDVPEETVAFKVARTAEPVLDHLEYISTALDPMGSGEWHLYYQSEQYPEITSLKPISIAA